MKIFTEISPAFYKTKLLNAISQKEKILVAYIEVRNRPFRDSDFLRGEKKFDHVSITGNFFKKCYKLASLLKASRYEELIVGGYDRIYCWLSVICSPRKKNAVIIESTLRDTKKCGLRAFMKRLFFKRVSKAYVCGKSHADLVRFFGFNGTIVDIGSVGYIRRVPQPTYQKREKVEQFLYVGRLAPVKNLQWTIQRFASHPNLQLTIIGTGELEDRLKQNAPANVHFMGAVPNTELPRYYQEADVFVLPSYYEPYGLVVEEALNNGTPVLVSNMIGCQDNLVAANNAGLVFDVDDIDDFENKLDRIRDVQTYNQFRENISKLDFAKLEENMVNAFIG